MQIKFQKSIKEYDYLIMFDLASRVSGVCIWDLRNNRPLRTEIIKVTGNSELPVAELYDALSCFFNNLEKEGIDKNKILVYQEAMPVQLRGGSSTVQTFLSLARSHSALDLYTFYNDIPIYDYVGVYPISTHSYLRKINEWDAKHKIEKNDIKSFVEETYGLSDLTFDEADAVFLAKTFVDIKWNKDLDEAIRGLKRHIKELKAERSINACLEEKKRLEGLKTAHN